MNGAPAGVLLLLTWSLWAGALIGIGLPLTRGVVRLRSGESRWRYAAAGWVGLSVVTVVVLAFQLVIAMGSPAARVAGWVLVLAGWVLLLRHLGAGRRRWRSQGIRSSGPGLVVCAVIGVGVVLAALWAAGTPTNYDTGLYHAQSIWYARDFATIPGLANLHDRLGFNSSMWPMSAFLSLGLWTGEEFRLFNGVLVVLASVDVASRLMTPRLRGSAGTLLLVAGMVLTLGVIAQYPGRLIASSAQDTAALVLTLAALAVMLDALLRSGPWRRSGAIAVLLSAQVALMRPLGWVFAAVLVLVTLVVSLRRLGRWKTVTLYAPTWILSTSALLVMLVRDTILSGWLLFPLSVAPMPVPWRMLDPVSTARDITGWARTPFQDVDLTLASGNWLGGWVMRLPTDWSIPVLLALAALLAALLALTRTRAVFLRSWRAVLLAEVPVLCTLVLWFLNAPDPRFAWGYLVCLGLIPVAVVIAGVGWDRMWKVSWSLAFAALLVLAAARGSFASLSWSLSPMPSVPVRIERLADGTEVKVPEVGDQCWGRYPLCAPDYANRAIEGRGVPVGAGFAPADDLR